MRRILGIAAILTGVASASSAETSYKVCAIDGALRFLASPRLAVSFKLH